MTHAATQFCSGGQPQYACQPGYRCIDNWWPVDDECEAVGCKRDACQPNFECVASGASATCQPMVRAKGWVRVVMVGVYPPGGRAGHCRARDTCQRPLLAFTQPLPDLQGCLRDGCQAYYDCDQGSATCKPTVRDACGVYGVVRSVMCYQHALEHQCAPHPHPRPSPPALPLLAGLPAGRLPVELRMRRRLKRLQAHSGWGVAVRRTRLQPAACLLVARVLIALSCRHCCRGASGTAAARQDISATHLQRSARRRRAWRAVFLLAPAAGNCRRQMSGRTAFPTPTPPTDCPFLPLPHLCSALQGCLVEGCKDGYECNKDTTYCDEKVPPLLLRCLRRCLQGQSECQQ